MRRRLLIALFAALPLAGLAVAYGCSSGQVFESSCAWLADGENCFREFREDMVNSGKDPENNPQGDCTPHAWTPVVPTEANNPSDNNNLGKANGTFLKRDGLDLCVLSNGGSIAVDPPIDPDNFPGDLLSAPTTYSFKITMPNGFECGTATYTSPHGFSITINPLPNQDAGAVDGGSDAGTVADAGTVGDAGEDDGAAPITNGTFTSIIAPGADAFDVVCPSGETHHFNLNETGFDGKTEDSCPGLAPLLPFASLQLNPGAVDIDGALSFAISYPPPDDMGADIHQDGGLKVATAGKPTSIVYFNCVVPAKPESCFNLVQDPGESDVDCGGPQIPSMKQPGNCPSRCENGKHCICNADCISGLCTNSGMTGLRTCVDPGSVPPGGDTTGVKACNYDPNAGTGGGSSTSSTSSTTSTTSGAGGADAGG